MGIRDYKPLAANNYYHIFNRGNNKMKLFLSSQDYLVFLHRFSSALAVEGYGNFSTSRVRIKPFTRDSFTILCYCLMPNHFHMLIRQNGNIGVDKLVLKVCTSYAKYFNLKYGHSGHVFQGAFKAKLVDSEGYLLRLSAYIHLNPKTPFSYPYSSLQKYLGLSLDPVCDTSMILNFFKNKDKYKEFLKLCGKGTL
jgi:putative transposase